MGGGERAADHPAPGVADEVRALDPESVEHIDDALRALFEREWCSESLAFAVAGGVHQDDPMVGSEVAGLCQPHVAVHQEARPEHDWLTAAPNAHAHVAECGVERH
jgi:hypothetical protein